MEGQFGLRRGFDGLRTFRFSGLHVTAEEIEESHKEDFINFSPAVYDKVVKVNRAEIRSWNLHLRRDKSIDDLSRMFNPIIRVWLRYHGRVYRSALDSPMRQRDRSLARRVSGNTEAAQASAESD